MEFGLLNFSSDNIKLSEIPQSLLSTNVVRIIPVNFGSTAQSILFSKVINLDFTSTAAAYLTVLVTSKMP